MKQAILWIEDEIYRIDHLVDVLQSHNLEVITASAEQEWEKYLKMEESFFNLVILDIMLPKGVNTNNEKASTWRKRGEVLLGKIRKLWPKVPIVIFTAKPAVENKTRLQKIGATEYIEKPVTVRKFEEIILDTLHKQKVEIKYE